MAVAKRTRTNANKTKVDFMKGVNNIGTPVALGLGVATGKWAISKLSNSKAVSGLLGTDNVKRYAIPAGVGIIGLVTPQFSKNKMVHMGGYGVATAGVEQLIENFTGKSLMGGLSSLLGETGMPAPIPSTAIERAKYLPAADIDVEAELDKPYAPVEGTTDNLIYSDSIGDLDDYEIGSAAFNHEEGNYEDEEHDPFSGDMPH